MFWFFLCHIGILKQFLFRFAGQKRRWTSLLNSRRLILNHDACIMDTFDSIFFTKFYRCITFCSWLHPYILYFQLFHFFQNLFCYYGRGYKNHHIYLLFCCRKSRVDLFSQDFFFIGIDWNNLVSSLQKIF